MNTEKWAICHSRYLQCSNKCKKKQGISDLNWNEKKIEIQMNGRASMVIVYGLPFVIGRWNCPFLCLLFSFLLSAVTKISGCSLASHVYFFFLDFENILKGPFFVFQSRQIRRSDGDEHFLSGVNATSVIIDRRLLTSQIRFLIWSYFFLSSKFFDQMKSQSACIKIIDTPTACIHTDQHRSPIYRFSGNTTNIRTN